MELLRWCGWWSCWECFYRSFDEGNCHDKQKRQAYDGSENLCPFRGGKGLEPSRSVPSKTFANLLRRLRELRKANGLTQEGFAELAGMSYKYYQAVEAGRKKELQFPTLERLAAAYGIELWELLAPTMPAVRLTRAAKKITSREVDAARGTRKRRRNPVAPGKGAKD